MVYIVKFVLIVYIYVPCFKFLINIIRWKKSFDSIAISHKLHAWILGLFYWRMSSWKK
jgi:hypothetical protein